MNPVEERVRRALSDLADQVRPTDILVRLDWMDVRPARVAVRQWATAFAAVVLATVVAVGALVQLRTEDPTIVEPVDRPPKVIRLVDDATPAPGRVHLAVTLGPADWDGEAVTYVKGADGGPATRVPSSTAVPRPESRHLSADGTRLIFSDIGRPRLEILDLRTGSRDQLGGREGNCPQLSPDHRMIASWSPVDGGLRLLDTRSRAERPGPSDRVLEARVVTHCGGTGLGWSPDGQLLAVPAAKGSFVADGRGTVRHRLPRRYAVNNSQSWSPDGRALLLYDEGRTRFVVHDLETGRESSLGVPREERRPLGWAGSRVVWLVGQPGDQRLITTDQRGEDQRTWTRFEVGNRVVDSVSWSRDLAGRAAD